MIRFKLKSAEDERCKTIGEKKQDLKQITLLLPEVLIEHYKEKAARLGIGYRTLIRLKLMDDFLKLNFDTPNKKILLYQRFPDTL